MLSETNDFPNLPENPNKRKIFSETLQQLDKDTGFDCFSQLDRLENAESIRRMIEEKLKEKGGTKSNEVRAILYRVDLPEKYFRALPPSEEEAVQVLAGMILERVFMKIRSRLPALFTT